MSGVKTGFTQTAGEILVSQVKKNGREVLFVVLKSSDRFGETKKLVSWVFDNIVWKEIDEINPAILLQQQQVDKPQTLCLLQKQI